MPKQSEEEYHAPYVIVVAPKGAPHSTEQKAAVGEAIVRTTKAAVCVVQDPVFCPVCVAARPQH